MTKAPILTSPDFTKTFVLEVDARNYRDGAILMQDKSPIAYMSQSLSVKHQGLLTYEKKLIALL